MTCINDKNIIHYVFKRMLFQKNCEKDNLDPRASYRYDRLGVYHSSKKPWDRGCEKEVHLKIFKKYVVKTNKQLSFIIIGFLKRAFEMRCGKLELRNSN